MNCEMFINLGGTADSVPTGSWELTSDKPHKSGVRWNKTSGLRDGGTVYEAGTSILQGGEDVRKIDLPGLQQSDRNISGGIIIPQCPFPFAGCI